MVWDGGRGKYLHFEESILMSKKILESYLAQYHYPERYLRGVDPVQKKLEMRIAELRERASGVPDYRPVPSDKGQKTVPSTYTRQWHDMFPGATTLPAAAKSTGVPVDVLKRVYNKGLAAWRGGHHRPGASQHAWAMARVYSFLLKGRTHYTADKRLAEEASERSARAGSFWAS